MPAPPTKMSGDMIPRGVFVSKDEIPKTVHPPTVNEERRVNISYRPRSSIYDRLRDIAHEERRTMQSICDEAIDMWLAARDRG